MGLDFSTIERQLTEALPEVRPAAEYYWKVEGEEGKDSGAYIFFESMFARYVEILLAMPTSASRDRLLRRAFGFVEEMLQSPDLEVQNLAYIGLYEGRPGWWLRRAVKFIGANSQTVLNEYYPEWREITKSEKSVREETIDLYGVRQVIVRELEIDGVRADEVPGSTDLVTWN